MLLNVIWYLYGVNRTKSIVSMLGNNHNFDISRDKETMDFVMLMIMVSSLTDKEIAREVLEMHTVGKKVPTEK